MPDFKLTYFDFPVRAEAIRLTLEVVGADWEDIRVGNDEWKEMSSKCTSSTPFRFPWLPHLEVVGENLVVSQSLPALRLVGKRFGIYGHGEAENVEVESLLEVYNDCLNQYIKVKFNPKPVEEIKICRQELRKLGGFLEKILENNGSGYLVGKELTVADVAIYSVLREASMALQEKGGGPINWESLGRLKAHHEKIASHPKIKAYYSK